MWRSWSQFYLKKLVLDEVFDDLTQKSHSALKVEENNWIQISVIV